MREIRNKRAVSPVIATVILVAVAITIAVAVAYWMGGISSQYTRFEKIEITSAYCESTTGTWGESRPCWKITLDLRNTGTTEATIIAAFVNSKQIADYGCYNSSTVFVRDNIRAYNTSISSTNQIDFANVYSGNNPIKITVTPGSTQKVLLEILQTPAGSPAPYNFSAGTTVEVSLHTGAGNTYMKMITLS
jgi:flagellin-like protein